MSSSVKAGTSGDGRSSKVIDDSVEGHYCMNYTDGPEGHPRVVLPPYSTTHSLLLWEVRGGE